MINGFVAIAVMRYVNKRLKELNINDGFSSVGTVIPSILLGWTYMYRLDHKRYIWRIEERMNDYRFKKLKGE